MLAPEWLLMHFITTQGAGLVDSGAMKTWLLGLELWHTINSYPWHGTAHIKRAAPGVHADAPIYSRLPKHAPVTILHLRMLHEDLDLNETFDATVYATATIYFWSQC